MEPFLEPPIAEPPMELPPDPKKLRRMKKKLDELNRQIRHSKKKNNRLIHKQNLLRKAIEDLHLWGGPQGLKPGTKPEPVTEPDWTFMEREKAFNGAYRS